MSSDFNAFKNGLTVGSHQGKQVSIDKEAVSRTLKHLAAPVFDFFSKEAEEAATPTSLNIEEDIQKYEMKSAIIQRILNDADPNSRTKMNVVI